MKTRFIIIAAIMAILSAPVSAQFTTGLAYYHMDGDDITLGAIVGSVGYRIPINDSFSVIPEIRGGVGVKDDTFLGADIELDSLFGSALRLEFLLSESFYIHLTPSYVRYKVKASGSFVSISDTTDEFGIGGGLGFSFTENFSLEANYENIDGLDVIQLGARFSF